MHIIDLAVLCGYRESDQLEVFAPSEKDETSLSCSKHAQSVSNVTLTCPFNLYNMHSVQCGLKKYSSSYNSSARSADQKQRL